MKALMLAVLGAVAAMAVPALAQDKVSLRLATVFDGPTVELWQPVLDDFMKAHPDIEVKMDTVAGSGAAVYPDVLRTAMASGDPPDVFFMWGGSSRPGRFAPSMTTMRNTNGASASRSGSTIA